jgi:hypothetical protein
MPATLAENAPAYAVVGSALSFSGFMIRRWIGRMDDAMEAYERGRREGEGINAGSHGSRSTRSACGARCPACWPNCPTFRR